jgi:starch synthase (maltosyl-transferring)
MQQSDGRRRVVIENIGSEIDCGRFPAKGVAYEFFTVRADIFTDGHDALSARVLYRGLGEQEWKEAPLRPAENDRWTGEIPLGPPGTVEYKLEAWIDHFATWQRDLAKKRDAGTLTGTDLLIGASHIEAAAQKASPAEQQTLDRFARRLRENDVSAAADRSLSERMSRIPDRSLAASNENVLQITVDRERAAFSAWYELFPRSCGPVAGEHGTLRDCERLVPEIAAMGFDVLYLPPIHPIGTSYRKGRNNSLRAEPEDVGSPWAIGSPEGGHKAVHPRLGTLEDFTHLAEAAQALGMEIALDLAFQCSPDHPYVKEHPEWFKWRPDGSIQYAENPPKKYEDIVPLNFETHDWRALWEELKSIVLFWIDRGVRIFRVDNPHTKPFAFWAWLIGEIKADHPDVFFLAEAFTRPKAMYRLAKLGFSQSYTYFTWRNTKQELTHYLTELTGPPVKEFFRPNFWPNTPDILPEILQYGGMPAFRLRLVLAATLSSNYGIYGPAYQLTVSEALPGREEYLFSEKYELKHWDFGKPGTLRDFITRVNKIRGQNPALQRTQNLRLYWTDNDYLLFYGKATPDLTNVILTVVNLDPYRTQGGWITFTGAEMGITPGQPYLVHDLLSDDKYIWQGERNFVSLNPQTAPAAIFKVRTRLRRETDFDYFM